MCVMWPVQLLNFILDLRPRTRVFAAKEKHLMFLIECFSQELESDTRTHSRTEIHRLIWQLQGDKQEPTPTHNDTLGLCWHFSTLLCLLLLFFLPPPSVCVGFVGEGRKGRWGRKEHHLPISLHLIMSSRQVAASALMSCTLTSLQVLPKCRRTKRNKNTYITRRKTREFADQTSKEKDKRKRENMRNAREYVLSWVTYYQL